MSSWVPRIWIEVWVGTYDRIRRPVNRYVPKIPPFQGGENVMRLTLGWVIDRSFTPVAQQAAPSVPVSSTRVARNAFFVQLQKCIVMMPS